MKKITYLIPVYNEIRTVRRAIEDIINLKYSNKEILIIDNGSTDGSQKIINTFKKNKIIKIILRKKNLGYGKTIEEGIKKAKGEYIFIQYADLEYDYKISTKMIQLAEKNQLDVIIGSRLKKLHEKNIIKILLKKPAYLATIICTFLINKFYNRNFTDIIGGKFYRTNSVKKIAINSHHAGFDFEFFSRICKKKLKIRELFIKYKPRENSAEKKIKFYHMINALYELFKVKFFER
jgi:glycosyltransferase involved in cell wall biosynthesis